MLIYVETESFKKNLRRNYIKSRKNNRRRKRYNVAMERIFYIKKMMYTVKQWRMRYSTQKKNGETTEQNEITKEELVEAIKMPKTDKAALHDGITTDIVKRHG